MSEQTNDIKIRIEAIGVNPLERGRIIDHMGAAILASIPRRPETRISVDVFGVTNDGKPFGPFGVDINYRVPEEKK